MRITAKLAAAGAATLLALGLVSCASDPAAEPGGEGGGEGGNSAVTIGIKFDQPGLGQKVGSGYEGFDIDVAEYVADELGYTDITYKEAPSAQRETLIESGQVDMIFATYSITDERAEKVSFAGPYLVAGQDLLVRSDDDSISGPDDMDGKKLCSVTGSTSAKTIQEEYADQVQLQEYDTYSKCVGPIINGTLDAMTTDDAILAGYAAQPQYEGKLQLVGKTFTEENYGVGIKKGDVELCEKINDALTKMVDEGAWQEAIDKHFGPASYTPNPDNNPPEHVACE